ncbi:hypothetical protein E2C01_064705 [Portunus trituberculatus]|uniref:Uncharacterized protein n=1 Tax=Portunus trituberculatus TaxID=210409 RepID=A0A5B7HKI4_PORTR|nr:hypothetical protein [Portunus trituberculatus]
MWGDERDEEEGEKGDKGKEITSSRDVPKGDIQQPQALEMKKKKKKKKKKARPDGSQDNTPHLSLSAIRGNHSCWKKASLQCRFCLSSCRGTAVCVFFKELWTCSSSSIRGGSVRCNIISNCRLHLQLIFCRYISR